MSKKPRDEKQTSQQKTVGTRPPDVMEERRIIIDIGDNLRAVLEMMYAAEETP